MSTLATTNLKNPNSLVNSVVLNNNGSVTVSGITTFNAPVAHPLGAVGTPSITFTGDLNTGFWSPTADTLAASTAGTERLRIADTGAFGLSGANYGTAGQILKSQGSSAAPLWSTALDYQEFISSGTWTKPVGATSVYVEVVGGGCGGGSGARYLAGGSGRCGGGGGSGGVRLDAWFAASALASTVSVTVGAGGTGGAAVAFGDNTPGNAGAIGGESSFGTHLVSGTNNGSGVGGAGGPSSSSGGTITNFRLFSTNWNGSNGGAGATVAVPTVPAGSNSVIGGAGGGGGAGRGPGVTTALTGGLGGVNRTLASSSTGAGAGVNGTANESGGGGGGSYTTAAAGMNGGNGGFPGGGGGGGSASDNGFTSGAGGTGGAGVVRIWSW